MTPRQTNPDVGVPRSRAKGLAVGLLLLLGTGVACAQSLSPLQGNIEQLPGPTGRRPSPPSGTALSVLPEDLAQTRLTTGYLLEMQVYNDPEMASSLRVNESGDVSVPLIGPVHVAGETVSEAERTIAQALITGQMLTAPQVTLNVLQYTASNITVLGEVQFPGRIQILVPRNLADVLALAGGELLSAGNEIEIRHGSQSSQGTPEVTRVHYVQGSSPDALHSILVNPGDTVFVRRAGVIYVLGAVNRPGGYIMVNGGSLNILQAVALASGTTNIAADGQIRIIRPTERGQFTEVNVPYKQIARGHAPPFPLQPEDIVYVPTSTLKNVLINGSGIVGTTASAAIYRVP